MLVVSSLEETKDGIVYKNIESEAEMVAVTNMLFDDFVKGAFLMFCRNDNYFINDLF